MITRMQQSDQSDSSNKLPLQCSYLHFYSEDLVVLIKHGRKILAFELILRAKVSILFAGKL